MLLYYISSYLKNKLRMIYFILYPDAFNLYDEFEEKLGMHEKIDFDELIKLF